FLSYAFNIHDESDNNTFHLLRALTNHLGFAALAAAEQNDTFHYPLEQFVSALKKGFLMLDPALQKKAELLAKEYYRNLGKPDLLLLNQFEIEEKEAKMLKKQMGFTLFGELENKKTHILLTQLLDRVTNLLKDTNVKKQTLQNYDTFAKEIAATPGL